MKKVFAIFLAALFLVSAMGLTLNAHYCGAKLQSVSLIVKDCCCNGSMADGCCKNEIKYIKITDHYSPSSQLQVEKVDIAPVILSFPFPSALCPLTSSIIFNTHSPPPKFSDPVIAFRSLLI